MRQFDELNVLSKSEKIDISTYFDDMELSEEEKEKRKEFSMKFSEMLLFIFALFAVMLEHNYINRQFIINQLRSNYSEIVKGFIDIDKFLDRYIKDFSEEMVDTTLKHIEDSYLSNMERDVLYKASVTKYINDDYWTSEERSALVSVNEANTILGYNQMKEAIKQGYTRKQWITERDNKVRITHKEVDGKIVNISDYFSVGDSFLLYPHDQVSELGRLSNPKEIVGCRCSVKYFVN